MTTCKVTFLIVAVVAISSIPTTESQNPAKQPLSLTPKRYPQPPGNIGRPPPPPSYPKRFHHFDLDLLKAAAEQIQGNFMISPASIKSTLGMLLEAAQGTAATELRQALRLSKDTNEQRELFKSFLTSTNLRSDGVNLKTANRIFLNDQLTPNPKYQEVLKNYYQSDILPTNFGDQQHAVNLINYWIAEATSNKVKDFISGGDFDPATIMIMANALYFKGNWEVAFDVEDTREMCFYATESKCHPVNMMEMQADFNYGYIEALNSNAIEIPYKGGKYSMVIILPKEQGDINSVVKDLNHISFKDILNQMSESEVQLSLPKFQIDFESELIPLLKKVGISEVFTPNANLSNIVTGGFQNPQVNGVIHKTHIEVSEKGAVAAAVTGAVVIPLMGTTLEIMNLNHPFLFFIRDKTTGTILFGGRVNEPTQYQKNSQSVQGQASEQAGPRSDDPQASGRPNYGNPGNVAQKQSPQNVQNIAFSSSDSNNPQFNQQDPPKNTNARNEQPTAAKYQQSNPSIYSNRRADGNNIGKLRSASDSRKRRQLLDCTTTHCELKTLPVNEADLRQHREQELKQHQEKLISEENLRQHLEYELKQKQEQELNQQQQQLLSEQIYRRRQEEEARQKEINAENLRKSQELQRRQVEAQKLSREERERQELKIKQELEDLAVKQQDEELRHQEAQAELFRQNQEYEFQQKIAEEKLLNEQKSQELKQLRTQALEEHNFRQQLEQELKQKEEQERNLKQRLEEEFQLKRQQEQLILEQHLRLQNETQQKEVLTQEENFRIQQEQERKQKEEQELKNQANKLQYEQNLSQLLEAEQRQIEAQTELIRQIQEIELRQKEAQELKLSKIQGHQQGQSSLAEHQQIEQNLQLSGNNPGQYTAFNPGQSSSNNPIQYSNQNLGHNSDFAQHQGQQYQQQRRA